MNAVSTCSVITLVVKYTHSSSIDQDFGPVTSLTVLYLQVFDEGSLVQR